jgi:hypothetical protein
MVMKYCDPYIIMVMNTPTQHCEHGPVHVIEELTSFASSLEGIRPELFYRFASLC